jgi:hypothetical protein
LLVLGAALVATAAGHSGSKVAAAALLSLVAVVAALRLPAAVTLLMLSTTALVGTVLTVTDVSPRLLIDLPLAGLVGATLWRWLGEPGRRLRQIPLPLALVLAYVAVSAAQGLVSPDLSLAQSDFRSTAWQVAVVPAIALAGWPFAVRRRIADGFLVVICLVAAYAVLRLAIGPAEAERETTLSLSPTLLPSGDLGLFGSMVSRHQLAAWCGVALPFGFALAVASTGARRAVALAATGLSAVALVGTQARGGFVGAMVGVAAALATYALAGALPRPRLRAAGVALAVLFASLALGYGATAADSDQVAVRYTALGSPGGDPALETRVDRWREVADDVASRPLGHGFGTGGLTLENSYLRVAYEQGPLLMLLYLAVVAALALGLARAAIRDRDGPGGAIATACLGGFAACCVGLLVMDSVEAALVAWTLAGLGIAGLAARPTAA